LDEALVRVADGIAARGWYVGEEFLAPPPLAGLVAHAEFCRAADLLRPAAIGRGAGRRRLRSVRRDRIQWIDSGNPPPPLRPFLERVETLRLTLNRELCAGLWEVETQLACYEPGGFYRRHLDQFAEAQARRVTLILYLNHDWSAADGGALRMYVGEGETPIDVLPERGRFVVFRSDAVEHEVLASARLRFSLTAWFRRRELSG
jgi:SM-20-related protein